MPVADRSQTERIRRMRAQIQAVRRAECFTCLEEGPRGPVDESTRTSRKFGQSIYYKQNASGQVTPTGCCGSGSQLSVRFTLCGQTETITFKAGQPVMFTNNTGSDIAVIEAGYTYGTIAPDVLVFDSESRPISIPFDATFTLQATCMFNLVKALNQDVSGPLIVGYNATLFPILVQRNGVGPTRTVAPGEAIGPFIPGEFYNGT